MAHIQPYSTNEESDIERDFTFSKTDDIFAEINEKENKGNNIKLYMKSNHFAKSKPKLYKKEMDYCRLWDWATVGRGKLAMSIGERKEKQVYSSS